MLPGKTEWLASNPTDRPFADTAWRNLRGSTVTDLAELQSQMEATYGARDRVRGIPATVAWLAEEVGELAKAVRKGSRDEQLHELGDTLAWLASLANQLGRVPRRRGRSVRVRLPSMRRHALRLRGVNGAV